MKVVILAGGQQSTISNVGEGIPKPMVEIGGKPLLWHIMKHFAGYGLREFIVCGGYRVDMIKDYFMDFYIYESDITVDLERNTIEVHRKKTEDWKVTVVDTGLDASPGQRIAQIGRYLEGEASGEDRENAFLVTYGDCLSDVDMGALIDAHRRENRLVTLVTARPQGRKRLLAINEKGLLSYGETNSVGALAGAAWVNADCFLLDRKVLDCLQGPCDLETQVFQALSRQEQVAVYRHEGFWMTVETRRDLAEAENLWSAGKAPWIL